MSGNGSLISSCSIGGQSIDSGWCQQYYPDGDGKQCNAVISGSVVSLPRRMHSVRSGEGWGWGWGSNLCVVSEVD